MVGRLGIVEFHLVLCIQNDCEAIGISWFRSTPLNMTLWLSLNESYIINSYPGNMVFLNRHLKAYYDCS